MVAVVLLLLYCIVLLLLLCVHVHVCVGGWVGLLPTGAVLEFRIHAYSMYILSMYCYNRFSILFLMHGKRINKSVDLSCAQ